MRRREALRSAGAVAALGLLGSLAGCQTTPQAEQSSSVAPGGVTPAAVPTRAAEATVARTVVEPRPRRTVVRALYVPTVDRIRGLERLDSTTVGGDDDSRHVLVVVNESATAWRADLRIGTVGRDDADPLVSTTVETPPRTYAVYELTLAEGYRIRIEGDDVDTLDQRVTDEYTLSADWFERSGSVTVAGITLDGYWRGTLLNRPLYDELVGE